MSNTYELVCTDCRASIWIAQGWIYPGDPLETIQASGRLRSTPGRLSALRDFLFTHLGHALWFVDSDHVPYDTAEDEIEKTRKAGYA